MNQNYEKLEEQLKRAQALQAASTIFSWDNETLAPEGAVEKTSVYMGQLSMEYMKVMTSPEIKEAAKALEGGEGLTEVQQAIAEKVRKDIHDMDVIPPEEYQAYSELTAKAGTVWAKAKKQNDYSLFAPVLKDLISYQRKFAGYRAKDGQRLYDVLLEDYEEGFTMKELDRFFDRMRKEIVPLLKEVRKKLDMIDSSAVFQEYDIEKQKEFSRFLAEYLGFDFTKGVLGESEHPFTDSLHNEDVRITNHYYPDNLESAIFSVIHETGHALYEGGNSDEVTMTPVQGGASCGMHESQSRMFENVIGRSRAFWEPIYGKLQETFPEQLENLPLEDFIRIINRVHPDLIRTEADELTYCLHIMVRYEMEKKMIEECSVEDLPEMWNSLYEEYLGIRPETDTEGILQDVHWSFGGFGYFPSYALGNAFASQIYAQMEKDLEVEQLLKEGNLKPIREYLKEHIHQYGASRKTRRLLKDLTGEEFNPDYYVDYLKNKYTALYELN
ncbi:carboxypeptidase M32 [Cuneatibacter caecimuris]|uniref:Metal-dependent carboxypeptidase n=1 Tax=Cuneatibacter caecimuris TaxID=1796618 RepID=A0A4Q7PRX1_9FIRM|nr:carboxypeptidase M32 [Cuneatibacter caecimuris]RZT02020.1 carboxypeptidase Taq [Cuneatibacter caecimuris]